MNKVKYILLLIIVLIFSISIYGYEKAALILQNSFGAYEEIKIANYVIHRPEKWLLYYSKPRREDQVRLYGIIPVSFNGKLDQVTYTFMIFSEGGEENISFIEMADSDVRRKLWVMGHLNDKPDPKWKIISFSGHKALLFSEKGKPYSISVPELRLNIKTTSLDLLGAISEIDSGRNL